MTSAITNPLYGLKVGSAVFGDQLRFGSPVVRDGLTKFISGQSGTISMSGSSEYVYSDRMNQGSFGMSGSYGLSGIAKLSGKVSGYCGSTQANSGKTLSITMDAIDWAGVEYVDFNDISAAQLLEGLSAGPKAQLTTALKKFVAMQKALGSIDDPSRMVDGSGALKSEAREWVLAVEQFHKSYGTGFVMGVLWGGWGSAKLEFHTAADENRWKYGGSSSFTYVGTGTAVSIAAAYGGSKSGISQTATAKISVYYNGGCVQAKVEQWLKELNEIASKGLTALGGTEVTRNATLAAPLEAPPVPEFKEPKKDPKVTDLFKEIKGLDGLKAYAQAAAWEKHKAAGKDVSLSDFLSKASGPNDVSGLAKDKAQSILLPSTAADDADDDADDAARSLLLATPADMSKFEPLGVWIVNWAQLFPWLATGHDNAITKSAKALEWLRLKTMYQDCLTLTRIYDRLQGEGCSYELNGKEQGFGDIRDAFSQSAALIEEFIRSSPDVKAVQGKVQYFLSRLPEGAQTIYKVWDATPPLRRCELGAGVFIQDTPRVTTVADLEIEGADLKIKRADWPYAMTDYSALASLGRAWPFIIPNGQILTFVSVGSTQTSGILQVWKGVDRFMLSVSKKIAVADAGAAPFSLYDPSEKRVGLPFAWDDRTSCLSVICHHNVTFISSLEPRWPAEDLLGVTLQPIPFEAAAGLPNWKGCSMATGMGTLSKDLQALRDELSKISRYSFDSDYWSGVAFSEVDDTQDLFYSMEMLRLAYIGVTDEPPNIMPSR